MKIERRGFLGGVLGLFGAAAVPPNAAPVTPPAKETSDAEFWSEVAAQTRFEQDIKPVIFDTLARSASWWWVSGPRRSWVITLNHGDSGFFLNLSLSKEEVQKNRGAEAVASLIRAKATIAELTFMDVVAQDKRFSAAQKYAILQYGTVDIRERTQKELEPGGLA